jgi:hydrogenase expression/formation protein HypE
MNRIIRLGHGGGGRLTRDLIESLFLPAFRNPELESLGDSAVLEIGGQKIAFTTDGHVVTPPFYRGGDIGRLSICGTANDLAVMGAKPGYISCAVILEEGFPIESLEKITASMKSAADEAGVSIVAGDTKVVGKGKGDGIFIATAGIGPVVYPHPLGPENVEVGDVVLVNGPLGDHAAAVLCARGEFGMEIDLESDNASLFGMISALIDAGVHIKVMRDLTRGGLTGCVCELARDRNWGFRLEEESIPVRDSVRGLCEMIGFDPLAMANEGKIVAVVARDDVEKALKALQSHPFGKDGAVIGTITPDHPGRACLETVAGGTRLLELPLGEELPRIC